MGRADRPAEVFQLDAATCRTLLGIHEVGRLVLPGSDPYVIPVNYTFRGDHLLLRTELRPVIEGALGRRVAFEVDMIDQRTRSGWSVVARGVASEAPADEAATESQTGPTPWVPGAVRTLIRIDVEEVSGRLLRGAVSADDPHGYL
jgi:nitroimidazol reductase NimA-like FMN-containing flavoprotein (pyridoxamine 5'-phosphate oxidase superfamily)